MHVIHQCFPFIVCETIVLHGSVVYFYIFLLRVYSMYNNSLSHLLWYVHVTLMHDCNDNMHAL